MGLPAENTEGYRQASAINFAEGLKGDLLIVHGSGDDNVHYQGTELLVNRLIELGKPFDFMTYPDRTHAISEGPGTTPHLYRLLTRYLTRHLPAGRASGPRRRTRSGADRLRGCDVLVDAEEVGRVVLALHRDQTLVVDAERGANGVVSLFADPGSSANRRRCGRASSPRRTGGSTRCAGRTRRDRPTPTGSRSRRPLAAARTRWHRARRGRRRRRTARPGPRSSGTSRRWRG